MAKHQFAKNALTEVDKVLKRDAESAELRRTLIIDDSLIPLLSMSVQGSFLKSRGFEKWYRLSNFHEATKDYPGSINPAGKWVVVIFLSSTATHPIQSAIVQCVLRLVTACQRGTIHVSICFVPRRTCAQVSYILLSVRHGLNVPLAAWLERGDELVLGRFSLSVADLPINLRSIDNDTFTLTFRTPYTLVHSEGSMSGIDSLLNNINAIIGSSSLAGIVSLVGVGLDGKIIAKKVAEQLMGCIGDMIDPNSSGLASSQLAPNNTAEFSKPTASPAPPGSRDTPLHGYVAYMLGLYRSPHDRDVSQAESQPATSATILTDEILSRCLVRQARSYDSDLTFVRDNMRESGLTRRAKQISFKIRISENSTRSSIHSCSSQLSGSLKSIIIMDRAIDWISPLLTPFTYEAMLDLQWGINGSNNLQIPWQSETVKLDGNLFLRLRDLLLSDIGPCLHEEALRIQACAPPPGTKMTAASTGSVNDMHQTLLKIKEYEQDHRELSVHIRLVSQLIQNLWKNPAYYTLLKIEDDILNNPTISIDAHVTTLCQLAWRNAPLIDVLRLLMLTILVKGPTSGSQIIDVRGVMLMTQSVLRALASVHGPAIYRVWQNLETSVFKSPVSQIEWPVAQTSNSQAPMGFVHSGVCPLSVEILEAIIKQRQHNACPSSNIWRQKIKMPSSPNREGDILLVFPHHVTYSELAALRCLAKTISRNFIVLAGSVLGYKSFLLNDRSCYSDLLSRTVL